MRKAIPVILVAILFALTITPVAAQEQTSASGISITTPYVGVAAKQGSTASFPLTITAPSGTRVDLGIEGLPDTWSTRFQGGGFVVDAVQVDSTGMAEVDLNVDVPTEATEDTYNATVVASVGNGSTTLDLNIRVAEEAAGEITMSAEFPSLRGDPDSSYSFNVDLDNGTPQEIEFVLGYDAPPGWEVQVEPSGEALASTVTVGGGDSTRLTVTANPPDDAGQGTYTIVPRAEGNGQSASVELTVELTGTFAIELNTVSGVLSTDVNAGAPTDVDLIVTNTGSAPLAGVTLSSSKPSSWDISYSPEAIDLIEPGASATVTATITPTDQAINGDYVVTLTASNSDALSSIDVRTTVETSAFWGLVGIGIIILALVGLSLVFRRYGRR